jgi:phage terminase large subunit
MAIEFEAFDKQVDVLECDKRFLGIFCGKRSGKTEVGAIKSIITHETKPNFQPQSRDPYLGTIVAPTHDMLRDLSWKKFLQYAKPFIKREWKTPLRLEWHDGSEIQGLSADKPQRLEGRKVSWSWIDEIFQVSEHTYLEMQARVADTKGYVFCTGSLGVQYINPRAHWVHQHFKRRIDPDMAVFEWATKDNPYFPIDEINRLKNSLDPRTYDSMFNITWDTIAQNAVYSDWDSNNETNIDYQHHLPTFCVIDWGWAHPMAVLFIQYDKDTDNVYVIDEIHGSHIKLEELLTRIRFKKYPITRWFCDIAGNQEREQTGISNVQWFERQGIELEFRQSSVLYGISLVRRYIKRFDGTRHLYVNSEKCPKLIETIKNYRYNEKNGEIVNENPVKEDDDLADSLRYFFINYLDDDLDQTIVTRPR